MCGEVDKAIVSQISMIFPMSKITITEFARGQPCTMRLPGVCNHDSTKTVWCHINSVRYGSGTRHKATDLIGLIACSSCHDVLDRRVKTDLDRDFVMMHAYEGHLESLALLVKAGIVS